LIVAGGGGGATAGRGQGGQITSYGGGPNPGYNGHGAPASYCGGGGGGFYSSGSNDQYYPSTGVGGSGFQQGGAGGEVAGWSPYQRGGFGGGAPSDYEGTCNLEGGAGGGYSGGSGLTNTSLQHTGYGGGSYNGGTSQSNTADYWSGDGEVTISFSSPGTRFISVSVPTSPSTLFSGGTYTFAFSCMGLTVSYENYYPHSRATGILYKGNSIVYELGDNYFDNSLPNQIIQSGMWVNLNPSLLNGTDYFLRIVDGYNSSFFSNSPYFTISPEGNSNITVWSIGESSLFFSGSDVTVHWTSRGVKSYLFSLYLLKGQSLVSVLCAHVLGTLMVYSDFTQTVSLSSLLFPGSDYRIKVVSDTDPTVYGISRNFSIVETGARFITVDVSYPSYYAGDYFSFSFSCVGLNVQDGSSQVDLYLYQGNSQISLFGSDRFVSPIIQMKSQWVSVDSLLNISHGTYYHVRVMDAYNSSFFGDSPVFTISRGHIVVHGVSYATYTPGTNLEVSWTGYGVRYVGIKLCDTPSCQTPISWNSGPENGTLTLLLPSSPAAGAHYFLRIESGSDSQVYATSRNFSLARGLPDDIYPYARYQANGFQSNLLWIDSSGNGRDLQPNQFVGSPQTLQNIAGTYGASKNFVVVAGTTSSAVYLKNPTFSNYTLFQIARYSGTNNNHGIITGQNENWFSGFWGGCSKVAYHQSWLTDNTCSSVDVNWNLLTDYPLNFRANGISKVVNQGAGVSHMPSLGINTGYSSFAGSGKSDWQIADVILFDSTLSTFQILEMESFLADLYGISSYAACPTGFVSLLGQCYFLTGSDSWNNTQSACRAVGGYLATINSAAENNAVASYYKKEMWIGLYRPGPSNLSVPLYGCSSVYTWADGSSANFTNWQPGEPNCSKKNLTGEYERCGRMSPSGLWSDFPCAVGLLPGLCKRSYPGSYSYTTRQTVKKTMKPKTGSDSYTTKQTVKKTVKPKTACASNCVRCTSGKECSSCAPGYYLYKKKCKACHKGCKTCDSSSNCLTCEFGLYLSQGNCAAFCPDGTYGRSGVCTACLDDCATCKDGYSCMSCNPGFFHSKGQCSACPLGCYFCDSLKSCSSCQPGFFLVHKQCIASSLRHDEVLRSIRGGH